MCDIMSAVPCDLYHSPAHIYKKDIFIRGLLFFLIRIHFNNNGKERKVFRTRSHQNNNIAHETTKENFAASKEEYS